MVDRIAVTSASLLALEVTKKRVFEADILWVVISLEIEIEMES